MIGPTPRFFDSKYFKQEPDWHLESGATNAEKKELEEYMNGGALTREYKRKHPEMKNPWYTWSGEIIDKK